MEIHQRPVQPDRGGVDPSVDSAELAKRGVGDRIRGGRLGDVDHRVRRASAASADVADRLLQIAAIASCQQDARTSCAVASPTPLEAPTITIIWSAGGFGVSFTSLFFSNWPTPHINA